MSSHLYDGTYVRQIRQLLYLIRKVQDKAEYRISCVLSRYQQLYKIIIVDNNADDCDAMAWHRHID